MTYLEERLASLADFLARIPIDILFADVRTPLLNDVLLKNVSLVECHQDLGHRWSEVRVDDADKTFDTSKQRFLVLFRGNHLLNGTLILFSNECRNIEMVTPSRTSVHTLGSQ